MILGYFLGDRDSVVTLYNKRLVESRSRFLASDTVSYYDYINPFVRGNTLRKKMYYDKDISKDSKTTTNSLLIESIESSQDRRELIYQRIYREIEAYRFSRFSDGFKPMKILVTYDSYHIVADILIHMGIFQLFYTVIDEFQSILHDSRFKSTTELKFLNVLQQRSHSALFVSATPMMDEYLEMLSEFKDLPYFELDWYTRDHSRVVKPNLKVLTMKSVGTKAEEIIETYLKGEFEINNITEYGKANKTSLVETDKDNGEHIEKHFVSLDGTITDYVFANDKAGNRYLYYKIADKNGNILYETEKKFKILSENHFLSETDGMSYDINIEQNKIKVKKLNNKNESIEYSIKEYSEEDYAAILSVLLECADNPEILKELEKNQITLGDIIVKQGLTEKFSIDKKLLKTLKNLSGEEWFALMKANVYTIISSINNTESTSCGKLIQIGKGKCVFPVLEHEIGHEKGRSLKLNEDTKLRQIFEYEKNLLFTNFPEMLIKHVDYFVTDSPSSNGFLETLAEVNHIINSAQKWERFGMRTLFLQQYFPKTIAYIANKYKDFN